MAEQELVAGMLNVLDKILSGTDEERIRAEEVYNSTPLATKLQLLLSVLSDNPEFKFRCLAAVLLRRNFVSHFEKIEKECSPQLQVQVRQSLLQLVQVEQAAPIRRKICDAIAELARCHQDKDGNNLWPEVLPTLFQMGRSESADLKEAALHIISSVPTIFGAQRSHYLSVIQQLLMMCLNDGTATVRFSACKATTAFISSLRGDPNRAAFASAIPLLVQVTAQSVDSHSEDAFAVLEGFLDICEKQPRLMREHLNDVIDLSLKIASITDLEDEKLRQLGLEIVVALAEEAPTMIRKRASRYIPLIVQQVLNFIVDIEEEADWDNKDEPDDGDEKSTSVCGEAALDRLAMALGGKVIMHHVTAALPAMLNNSDWKYRYGGLIAISAITVGCMAEMEPHLTEILNHILPFLRDSHARVQHAACHTVGQLSVDFAQDFQRKHHSTVVPALLVVMNDDSCIPRVQAHAVGALVKFISYLPQTLLLQYLNPMAIKAEELFGRALDGLIASGRTMVLQVVISLIATLADVGHKNFVLHYERFMPRLKFLLQNAIQKEHRQLRGKAIECITMIGQAAPEKLRPDAEPIMALLLKILQESDSGEMDASDPQISFMVEAWPRMASILEQQFVPYLQYVMPITMKMAQLQPEVVLLDSDETREQFDERDGWQFVTLADQQKFGIKTSGLQEKSSACETLTSFARELGEGFANYALDVAQLMKKLLKFYFDDDVRVPAAECLPYLLGCAKGGGDSAVETVWAEIKSELLFACQHEPERPVLTIILASFSDCIDTLGNGAFNAAEMETVVKVILERLNEHFQRLHEREQQKREEDHDEEAERSLEAEQESDEQVLSKIIDVMHSLFKANGRSFLPFFNFLLPRFAEMLGQDRTSVEQRCALCVFDDLLEFTGAEAFRYREYFLRPMVNSIGHVEPEMRQAACYGVGMMAMCGEKDFVPACVESLPLLVQVCSMEDKTNSFMTAAARDNAISAVAKICRFLPEGAVNVGEILPHWLSWLPIVTDEEEAPFVYGYLCELVMQNNAQILGENHSNLPRILSVLAQALENEMFNESEQTLQNVMTIVRQVQNSPETWQTVLMMLNKNEADTLLKATSDMQQLSS